MYSNYFNYHYNNYGLKCKYFKETVGVVLNDRGQQYKTP